ncbi:MAG: NAD-dependent epimerase/dehydratase family protein [Bacteroidia bacterium]
MPTNSTPVTTQESKETVLVTGADGMLGSHICRALLNKGYRVKAMTVPNSRSRWLLDGLPLEIIEGDILQNENKLLEYLSGCDYLINTAALTAVWPRHSEIVRKVNYDGALNIAHAAQKAGIKRMVHIGSASTFEGGNAEKLADKNAPFDGWELDLDYITSKFRAQEALIKMHEESGFPVIIINPTYMIGKYDSGPSSGKMILEYYKGNVPGYTNGGKNFVAAADVAAVAVNALQEGRLGQCYIAGNENLSYKEFFSKISHVSGIKKKLLHVPNFIMHIYGFISSVFARVFRKKPNISYSMALLSLKPQYYSCRKAVDELHMPQTPIDTAIKDCLNWFKENGYLK